MKKIFYILLFVQLFSCASETKEKTKNTTQKKEQSTEYKSVNTQSELNDKNKLNGEVVEKVKDSIKLQIIEHSTDHETIKDTSDTKKEVKINNDTVSASEMYLSTHKNENTQAKTEILLPTTYRDWDNKNPANSLNKSWFDLNKKESKYYLNKANYHIEKGEDECSGSFIKTINSSNNTLLLIKNRHLKIGEIYSINFDKDKIWSNEKIEFNYKNTTYTIRAEGDIIPTSHVENYKLYIATNNMSETMFLEKNELLDSFVKLLFVGDIDADGKLDFIFEANGDYEEQRVILYLSSEAKNGEIIKKAAEIAIQFDC